MRVRERLGGASQAGGELPLVMQIPSEDSALNKGDMKGEESLRDACLM
jgi:hypothetical protein